MKPPFTETALSRPRRGALGMLGGLLGPVRDRVVKAVDRRVDDFMSASMDEEFERRLARVPVALGSAGIDPFGLDPSWARYALAGVALLHRKYFRTEVFGAHN